MKKSLLILLCLSMSFFLMAQETVKQKEIGLVFSNLDNFGLTFKIGSNKSLWRFNTLILSGNNMNHTIDSSTNKSNSMGFGLKLGKEYRKELSDHFELRYGADISFNYSQSKSDYDDQRVDGYDRLYERTIYTPGVNLVFGVNYKFNNNFVIGAEILPYFSYQTGTTKETYSYIDNENEVKSDISGFNYGLSNTSVLLSLVYRFQ